MGGAQLISVRRNVQEKPVLVGRDKLKSARVVETTMRRRHTVLLWREIARGQKHNPVCKAGGNRDHVAGVTQIEIEDMR